MKTIPRASLLVLLWVLPVWAGNTHTPAGDTLQEHRAWWGDALTSGYVLASPAGLCQHSTSGSLSASIPSCRMYTSHPGPPLQLEYIEDLGNRTITYTAGAGTYWLVAHASISEAVSGWTRVVGTHYLWQKNASQPALPARAGWLLSATVSTTAITAVTDRRTIGSPVTTAFLALTDTPDTYVGQALKGVRVNAGATGLEFADVVAVSGDQITVNGVAIDTIANFVNTGQITFVRTPGPAGGPDAISGTLNTNSVLATHMATADHGAVRYASNVAIVEGVQSGTVFPTGPATGDMVWITDDSASGAGDSNAGTGQSFCRWTGTAWQCIGGDFVRNIKADCSLDITIGQWCLDSDDGQLFLGDGETATPFSGATQTLEGVRIQDNLDDTATSASVAPTWGGATSRCRIYEDPTLGAQIECFLVSGGTPLTFDTVIYNADPRRVILHNGGNRDVCLTMDDTGLQTYAAVESCGTIAGPVTFTGTVTMNGTAVGTGVYDLGGATSLEVPNNTAPTTDVAGEVAFDTNAYAAARGTLQVYDGTANTRVVATLATDTPSSGQVPTFQTGGTVTWESPRSRVSLQFGCTDADGADTTRFVTADEAHNAACRAAEDERTRRIIASTGTATHLACRVLTAPGSGTSAIFTVRVEGVDSNLTCTIANTATSCSSASGTTPVAAATERLSLAITYTGNPADNDWILCDVQITL